MGIPGSFVELVCLSVWTSWVDLLGKSDKWEAIYARDLYECACPVCFRRDCTLHHLQRRAQGGGDEEENCATLCAFCHLEGEHGGLLKVLPPASTMRWLIGRTPILEVLGREKRLVA